MSDEEDDLWPTIIDRSGEPSPLALIQRQAVVLRERTRHVHGVVSRSLATNGSSQITFDLLVPGAAGFRRQFLKFFVPFDGYPILITDWEGEERRANSYKEFVEQLRVILSSEKTIALVNALLRLIGNPK